jgi:hypothetical protein
MIKSYEDKIRELQLKCIGDYEQALKQVSQNQQKMMKLHEEAMGNEVRKYE